MLLLLPLACTTEKDPSSGDDACSHEVVDGVDNDCDGKVDEGGGDYDDDGDGYADYGDWDCDDTDATVYPGAPELCDGLDNDCDAVKDEDCTT